MNILTFHVINLENKETHICSNLALGLKKQSKSIRVIYILFVFWERIWEPDPAAGGIHHLSPANFPRGRARRYLPPQRRRTPAVHPAESIFPLARAPAAPPRPPALRAAPGGLRAGPRGLSVGPAHSRRRRQQRAAMGRTEPGRDGMLRTGMPLRRLLPSVLPGPAPLPPAGKKRPYLLRGAGASRALRGEAEVTGEAPLRRAAPAAETTARLGPAPGPSSAPGRGRRAALPGPLGAAPHLPPRPAGSPRPAPPRPRRGAERSGAQPGVGGCRGGGSAPSIPAGKVRGARSRPPAGSRCTGPRREVGGCGREEEEAAGGEEDM